MKYSGFCRIMVKVNCICFVVALFVRGAVSRAQDTTELPNYVPGGSLETGSTGGYPYGGAYDYGTKMYGGYTKQYKDYPTVYGDYLSPYGDYAAAYDDGTYDETSYDQYDDYTDTIDEIFAYGDRNNPKDAVQQMFPETDLSIANEVPWVYIIVPVVQIDVFVVDDEKKSLEDMEIQLPVETFFIELGDFGMAHLHLADFGMPEIQDYPYFDDYIYGYNDYPMMGHYHNSNIYDTADQLSDWPTLDYPGIDHDPTWIDWIMAVPPNEINHVLPIETFFFELGNFGMGHVDLLDFGMSELGFGEDSYTDYLQYDDYPTMGNYPNSNIYDTADQLSDWSTLDYPGIDHEPYWIDWIFMMPPEEINPIV